MKPKRTVARVNWKAIVGTLAAIASVVVGVFVASLVLKGQTRNAALAQVEELEKKKEYGLALRHAAQYLETHPDDIPMLERQVKITSETAGSIGSWEAAAKMHGRILQLDPNNPSRQENRKRQAELYLNISEVFAGQNAQGSALISGEISKQSSFPAALVLLQDVVKIDEQNGKEPDLDTHRLLARAHEGLAVEGNDEDLQRAIEEYNNVLETAPDDAVSALRLALIHLLRKKDSITASSVINALTSAAPDSKEAWLAARRFHLVANEPDDAAAALAKAAEVAPDDTSIRLTQASEAIAQGKPDAARAIIDQLPEKVRDDREVQSLLGFIAQAENDPEKAVDQFRKALILAQGSAPNVNLMLATTLVALGRLDEAQQALDRFKEIGGDAVEGLAQVVQGLIDERSGRLVEAIKELEDSRTICPAPYLPLLYLTLGRSYRKTGEREKALNAFRTAQRLNPKDPDPRIEIATLLGENRPEDALAELRASNDPAMRLAYARALLRQQALKPAADRNWTEFESALKDAQADPSKSASVAALRAQRFSVDGKTVEAARIAQDTLATSPKSLELWSVWAEALAASKQLDSALKTLETASEPANVGDHATLRIARSNLLTALGRGREGLEVLEKPADELPVEQRAILLNTIGKMRAARGEIAQARASYKTWAELQPGSLDPQIALLQLAILVGDDAGAREALERIKGDAPDGDKGLAYQLGLAEYLVRMAGPSGPDKKALDQAGSILDAVLEKSQGFSSAYLLRGRVRDLQGRPADAAADYRKALDGKVDSAQALLVNVLVRLGRFAEIDALPKAVPTTLANSTDRFAAEASLDAGKPDHARQYLERATQSLPKTPNVAQWRLSMLNRLGDTAELERDLREVTERTPDNVVAWLNLIRYQVQRGEIAAARETMTRLLPTVKADQRALVETQCLAALGDVEAADKSIEKALVDSPNDPNLPLIASRYFQESGRPERARELLEALRKQQPGNRPAARLLALSLSTGNDLDAVRWQAAWDALGPEPAAGEAGEDRLTRAIVLARNPDRVKSAQAVPILEALVADQPAGLPLAAAARETLAKALMILGEPARAAQIAAVTAASAPSVASLRLYLEALIQAKNWTEADRQFDRLATIAPSDVEVARLRVRLIEGKTDPTKLVAALTDAFGQRASQPDAPVFALAISQKLLPMGPEGRQAALSIAQALAKRSPAQSWLLAQVQAADSNDSAALESARAAIAKGDAKAIFEAARAILTVAQRQGAAGQLASTIDSAFTEALDRQPDLPGLKAVLAMWRHMQGNFDDEVRLYRDLLAADPDNALYNNNMAWALSEGVKKPDEALRYVDLSVRKTGRMPELLDTRGVVLTRLGRFDEAIADLSEAIRANDSPVYLFHLARAYQLAGQADQAKATLARAVERGLKPELIEAFERPELDSLAKL